MTSFGKAQVMIIKCLCIRSASNCNPCSDFDLRNINFSVSPPHLLLSFLMSLLSNIQQDRNNLVSWTNEWDFFFFFFPIILSPDR